MSTAGIDLLTTRSKVVCRECFGFGHARTTCPTRRKLDTLAKLDAICASGVGKYRSAAAAMKTENMGPYKVWPAIESSNTFASETASASQENYVLHVKKFD